MVPIIPVAFLNNLGVPELMLVAVIALFLFGPRLPTVMRNLGKGISEFKKGMRDTEEHVRREIENAGTDQPDKQIGHKSST